MGASGMGGQWYGGPLLWVALWPLKDPMLRRESGCAAVTPGVALAPSIRGSQWPPLSPLLRQPILLAASAPAPPAPHYGVCAQRCWVVGGSGRCREVTCLTGPGTFTTCRTDRAGARWDAVLGALVLRVVGLGAWAGGGVPW